MVYRTTLAPLGSLRREMDRLFDDAFFRAAPAPASWTPAVDIHETKDAWQFELELPGVSPEQVEVTAEQKVLRIRGEKAATRRDEQEGRWISLERVTGSFERSFRLPSNVREDGIEARFAHGVLTVTVPKAEVPVARRIEVKA
ncbi:MAG: Hsp20/alpha crystallin family protein [Gemmatimonadaceae bacterium]|nr:Hsp20/alpha crystallin family protein [Gemmatimonadaceae bacterium]